MNGLAPSEPPKEKSSPCLFQPPEAATSLGSHPCPQSLQSLGSPLTPPSPPSEKELVIALKVYLSNLGFSLTSKSLVPPAKFHLLCKVTDVLIDSGEQNEDIYGGLFQAIT